MQPFWKKIIHNQIFKFITQWSLIIIAIIGVALFLFTSVFNNQAIFGSSMQPNFNPGDRVLGNQLSAVKRGDVVILKAPDENGDHHYIKRIIGLPGDRIYASDDTLFVNGKPVSEPYLDTYKEKLAPGDHLTANFTLKQVTGTAKVPAGNYFVLGDNRRISRDSRQFGFVSADDIRSVVFLKYWPLNDVHFY
ncbi:signal peptidase I [Lactobacillus sp. CC-MHH1034]|uniref:signal peptidase I n=1 Tax=Agrilactobacillus fermenti TaxID=2586909 RepID=UPI001E37F073|nr:signal peptidase I [Agrilactobacillus fermenti]MCD2255399.1 signal peptidase I [Agrilactobacillus fermenti]